MKNLEPRIAALEQASPAGREPLTLIARLEAPGAVGAEVQTVRTIAGATWERRPGETEQELIDRASREAERNAIGVALLVAE